MARVRRAVLAEPETMLAATAGHLSQRCTTVRGRHYIDRDNTSPAPDPDGIAYRTVGGAETGALIGPFVKGPAATHIEMVIHYRCDDTASTAPSIKITLEKADALDGTDVDAPVVAATNGITLTGSELPGDESSPFRVVSLPLRNVEETPTSYPTDARCLDYHGTANDTLMQIRVVPTNVDAVVIDIEEIVVE